MEGVGGGSGACSALSSAPPHPPHPEEDTQTRQVKPEVIFLMRAKKAKVAVAPPPRHPATCKQSGRRLGADGSARRSSPISHLHFTPWKTACQPLKRGRLRLFVRLFIRQPSPPTSPPLPAPSPPCLSMGCVRFQVGLAGGLWLSAGFIHKCMTVPTSAQRGAHLMGSPNKAISPAGCRLLLLKVQKVQSGSWGVWIFKSSKKK